MILPSLRAGRARGESVRQGSAGQAGSRLRAVVVAAAGGLALGAGIATAADPPAAHPETRATMDQIFEALTTAFRDSLDEQRFQDPAHRKRVGAALRALADNAKRLQSHGRELNPSYDFLRRSLAEDAREIVLRYEQGSYEGARFLLHQLTEDCFACHSRVPSPRGFDLGRQFLETTDLANLTPEERVKLEVATRQFPAALATYERIFQDRSSPAAETSLSGAFEDYLKLVLRVGDDPARAAKTLARFRERSDVPRYLDRYLEGWIRSLHGLRPDVAPKQELARARELIRAGQLANFFPGDRQGLVHFVAASSLLHRRLERAKPGEADLSEIYYLLGVTESYISRSAWVSETEFFLESAVRSNPRSPFAERAYAFLEEYLVAGYTGSSGLHLPPETKALLKELHGLLGGATPARGPAER